jgi:ADP-ribose pyrophosphatase YjhB (NUDIX family)
MSDKLAVKIVVTSRAVIIENDSLFLVSSDGVSWHNPGGWLDGFESLEECLVREVFEETGVLIKPIQLIAVTEHKVYANESKFNQNFHKIEHHYLSKIINGDPLNKNCSDKDDLLIKYKKFFTKEELADQKYQIKPDFLKSILLEKFAKHIFFDKK